MQSIIPPLPFKDNPVTLRTRLDERTYLLTLFWNERTEGWYLDIVAPNGEAVLRGRRLSPSADLLGGIVPGTFSDVTGLAPTGRLFVLGNDPMTRDDLGTNLKMYYVSATELEAQQTPAATFAFREV
jgi:hypothetical protein